MVGCWLGLLVKWSAVCSIAQLIDSFVAWLVGWLLACLDGWLVGWLVGWWAGGLVAWLVGWLIDWPPGDVSGCHVFCSLCSGWLFVSDTVATDSCKHAISMPCQ